MSINEHSGVGASSTAKAGAIALLARILDDLETDWRGRAPDGADTEEAEASFGDLTDRLDERAFGFALLLLALPCCLPFVYILPQIVALPMAALAGQMAVGREDPWLPKALRRRSFEITGFRSVLGRSARYVGWIERLAKPRLTALTGHAGSRFIGALLLLPIGSILLPLPGTNTIPGIGVAIASLGLIERDGALIIFGVLIGWLWVLLLLVFGLEAATILKDMLATLF